MNEPTTAKRPGRKPAGKVSWSIRIRPEQREKVMQSVRQMGCLDVCEWLDKIMLNQSANEQIMNSITAEIINPK